ncbi:unnamed protein product [Phytophthora fragariaefolia]|uniref:Unnamed protein product n=1 Tax=Phytophthora fragariaefolia TaxID=1490495 RepID=A0A9W7D2Q0_9STRA|nr:unnamed protein product [Phytophthora fragariaefolia]
MADDQRGAGAGAGLRSQQQQAERAARELMDAKIEAAHLRERLRLRVGGDATAAELEAEAFALQTALGEAQHALRAREAALQALDARYQKAMGGLLRLDEAWKRSRAQADAAQHAQHAAERRAEAADAARRALEQQLQAAGAREAALTARVDALADEKRRAEQQRDARAQEAKDAEMQARELRAQLETTRQNWEAQMKQQEGATREDVRRLQEQLQRAQEDAAALRGEAHARQEEAAKVDAELRATKEADAACKQRLVKLTEDHATLRVHLESAKLVAVESTQRAIQAETENEELRKELEEREEALTEKEQAARALEEELLRKQNTMEDELMKKKRAVEEAVQRLTKESEEVLQAQEETWSCREKALQEEANKVREQLECTKAFHVELAQLLRIKQDDGTSEDQLESVEPAMLKALVVQEINKRDVLSSTLQQTKVKLVTTKRQLGAQKQLEADNAKLRAEYEKAKLAMERMATRKAKSFASTVSMPIRSAGHDSVGRSSSSETSVGKENRPGKNAALAPIVKRKLEIDKAEASDVRTTPRKAQRAKHVYVASRYLSSASKR